MVKEASGTGPHEAGQSGKARGGGLSTVHASHARRRGGEPRGASGDTSREGKHSSPDERRASDHGGDARYARRRAIDPRMESARQHPPDGTGDESGGDESGTCQRGEASRQAASLLRRLGVARLRAVTPPQLLVAPVAPTWAARRSATVRSTGSRRFRIASTPRFVRRLP